MYAVSKHGKVVTRFYGFFFSIDFLQYSVEKKMSFFLSGEEKRISWVSTLEVRNWTWPRTCHFGVKSRNSAAPEPAWVCLWGLVQASCPPPTTSAAQAKPALACRADWRGEGPILSSPRLWLTGGLRDPAALPLPPAARGRLLPPGGAGPRPAPAARRGLLRPAGWPGLQPGRWLTQNHSTKWNPCLESPRLPSLLLLGCKPLFSHGLGHSLIRRWVIRTGTEN